MNEKIERLKDIKTENQIWVIYIGIILLSWYANSKESMNKKIRQSNIMKNPYTVIIGDKERDNNLISYRKYGSEETNSMDIKEFINKIKEVMKER